MRNRFALQLTGVALTIVSAIALNGCYGLAVGQMGMHYQTEKSATLDSKTFKKIGVYAVSDGKTRSLVGSTAGLYAWGMWPFWIVPFPYSGTLISRPNASDMFGFTPSHFPDKIEIPFKIRTDSSTAGPSFELALAMQKELTERGYEAEAATDAPHKGHVTSDNLLTHAKQAGYEAAFVMVYTLFNRWQRLGGTQTVMGANMNTTIYNVKYTEGFLFIPSVALVDVATGAILWSSAYYGLVSNATTPNISNQAFSIAVNGAITESGRETYVDAAKVTVERLFNPSYWKGSYKPFPSPKQRTKGEKFDF
jgi:hypothetical protein